MLNIVLLIHLFTGGHQTSMFTTGFFTLIKDVFMIRPTPLWITHHALLIHHASDWFSCFCSSGGKSEWKFLLLDVTIFKYSECRVFSLSPPIILYSSLPFLLFSLRSVRCWGMRSSLRFESLWDWGKTTSLSALWYLWVCSHTPHLLHSALGQQCRK